MEYGSLGNLNDQRYNLFQKLQCFEEKWTRALPIDEKARKMVVEAKLEKITLIEEIS